MRSGYRHQYTSVNYSFCLGVLHHRELEAVIEGAEADFGAPTGAFECLCSPSMLMLSIVTTADVNGTEEVVGSNPEPQIAQRSESRSSLDFVYP
jgi:hypothetical protein